MSGTAVRIGTQARTMESPARGRVLMVSTNFGVGGGAEDQVSTLSVGLHKRGWDVSIVSMLPFGKLHSALDGTGIPVSTLGMKRGSADPRAIFDLAKAVREARPDIVHSHMTHANILARVARPLYDVPALISTLHGMKMYGVNKRFTYWRELGHRLTDRWADLTTTICEAAAQSYRDCAAVPAEKLQVILNGVDTSQFKPNAESRSRMRRALGVSGEFVWMAAGRIEKPKAYDLMVRSFARAAQAGTANGVLLICGSGSLETAVAGLISSLGMDGRVRLLGFRNDLPELLTAADGYLMSSETEGLPMALLQASATELPIVATDVGGNREVVLDGRTGLMVRPQDEVALASAIGRVEQMDALVRQEMGRAGRGNMERNFSNEKVLDQWERVYQSVMNRNADGPRKVN